MANPKKNDTRATKPAEAEAVNNVVDDDDEGYEEISTPDVDAWWHVRQGATIQGRVCGRLEMEGMGDTPGKRHIVLVRISKPAEGVQKGDGEKYLNKPAPEYEVGSVLGVTCRHRLMPLLECVRNSCLVKVTAVDKKPIGGGRSMWNFTIRVKGKRDVPPPIVNTMVPGFPTADADGYEDGATPF